MANSFFISGTDTGVGKTYASCALLQAAESRGLSTMGLKPVAAGCELIDGKVQNSDARQLLKYMSIALQYEQVNPIALKAATSPHIAAALEGRNVSSSRIVGFCRGALMQKPDFAVIEGAGGWYVPINSRETLADVARELDSPVILVVALRLGCLNHAILSAKAIQQSGLKLAGWIGNQVQSVKMDYEAEYIDSLQAAIPAPCLGILPYNETGDPQSAQSHLNLDCLFL